MTTTYSTSQVNGCCEASCSLGQYSTEGHDDDNRGKQGHKDDEMPALDQWLLIVNLAVAIGSALAGAISYLRKGFIFKFITSIDRIERTERKVNEIWEWRGDAEVVLIALAYDSDEVNQEKVKEKFGSEFTVNELRVKQRRQNGNKQNQEEEE